MSQKETIVNMLKTNGTMTQGALAEAIYETKIMDRIYMLR